MAKGIYYINPAKHKSSNEKLENFRKLNSGDYLNEKKVSFESQHYHKKENNSLNKVINSPLSNITGKITSTKIQGSASLSATKSSPEKPSYASKKVNASFQQPRCPEKVLGEFSDKKKILAKEYSSLFVFKPNNKIRLMAESITNAKFFDYFVILTILCACVVMAIDEPMPNHDKSDLNKFAEKTEWYFLGIFVGEAILKIIASGFVLHPNSYLRSLLNLADFFIIVISAATMLKLVPGANQLNLKGLRIIRLLHPVKAVTGFQSLHFVMKSIVKAILPLLQVLCLIVFVISIYAIIGLEFMFERFHYSCKNNSNGKFEDSTKACDHLSNETFFVHGRKCHNNQSCSRYVRGVNYGISSFDNIFLSMLTVFQCITLEGWVDIMYYTHDVMDINGIIWTIYYTTLILFGSFFMLHLALGVLSCEFAKEREKFENKRVFMKLREKKRLDQICDFYSKWISKGEDLMVFEKCQLTEKRNQTVLNEIITNPLVIFTMPNFQLPIQFSMSKLEVLHLQVKQMQVRMRYVVMHKYFFWFVFVMIAINSLILATKHYHQPNWLSDVQSFSEKAFIAFVIFEVLLKIFSLSLSGYFASSFNLFELLVVLLIIAEASLQIQAGISVLECLRFLQVFKVTKYWSTLKNLVTSFTNTINSIISLLCLILLYMLIMALLGMQLFGGRFANLQNPSRANFDKLTNSLLAVFQVITGEDWNAVMYSGMLAYGAPSNVSGVAISIYFLFLVVFGNYTLLNVFLAIAVDNLANADVLAQDENELRLNIDMHDKMNNAALKYGVQKFVKNVESNILRDQIFYNKVKESSGTKMNSSDTKMEIIYDRDADKCFKKENVIINSQAMMADYSNCRISTESIGDFSQGLNSNKFSLDPNPKFMGNYKKKVQKKWQNVVDYNTSEVISSNINKMLEKQFEGSLLKEKTSMEISIDTALGGNEETIQGTSCRNIAKLNLSAEDDYDIPSQIKSQGILNMLKVNIAQRKCLNPLPSVPNVSSLFVFSSKNRFRLLCHKIVHHQFFDIFMITMIALSSIALGIQDPVNDEAQINVILRYCDYAFTFIFGIEIFLKTVANGFVLHKGAYLRNPWNKLDALIFVCNLSSIVLYRFHFKSDVVIEVLGVFTVLRPVKAVQKIKKLKVVFHCMVYSFKNVAFVLIITLLMLFIFSCFGVQFFKGTLDFCNDSSKTLKGDCKGFFYQISSFENTKEEKIKLKPREWQKYKSNFDNIIEAVFTLYVSSTEDNWPTIMYTTIDSVGDGQGPLVNNRQYVAIFFIVFIVVFTFFIINIYIALIILTFQKHGEREIQCGLDRNQCDCLHFVLNAKPHKSFKPKDESSISYQMWLIVESRPFDCFIMSIIVMNFVLLMMKYNGMSTEYRNALSSLNIAFTTLFSLEALAKIIAYRLNYFKGLWNLFDLALVFGSLMDIFLSLIKSKSLDPSMFRLFRAARVIKLLRKSTNMRVMLLTFYRSVRALLYVTGLILLFSYVYAVLGMRLFGHIKLDGTVFHDKNNFQNVYRALVLLFRCSTGENWSLLMYGCYDSVECDDVYFSKTQIRNCGNTWAARIYFTSYVFFSMFLLLNLFLAIIMDNFEYLTSDSSILGPHHMDEFVRCWSKFDPHATGFITLSQLYEMMLQLLPPVGFGRHCPKTVAYKRLIRLDIPVNADGAVSFYTTLIALVRVGLDFCTKENRYENDKELKRIVKSLWPHMTSKTLDKFFPKLSENEKLTVGKIFCIKLLVMNFRKAKSGEEKIKSAPNVIQQIHSTLPHEKNLKQANEPTANIISFNSKQNKIRRNRTFSGILTKTKYDDKHVDVTDLSKTSINRYSSLGKEVPFYMYLSNTSNSGRNNDDAKIISSDNSNSLSSKFQTTSDPYSKVATDQSFSKDGT